MADPPATTHKTISPYDLTSGDNPGAVISQPLLKGSNYDEWALHFKMALSSHKKFGSLNGTITKPVVGSPQLEDWTANNHLIVGWIKLTIDPNLSSTISTREIAKDLWELIRKRFSVKSGARLQQLRIALSMCKQNGSSIDTYFGKLTKLWDGITECTITKCCECGGCTCDLNTARDQEQDVLKVHDFLAGLDDAIHGVVRSQIRATSPLPDLDTVYQTILQTETINSGKIETELMSFTSQIHHPQQPLSISKPTSQTIKPSTRINKDPSRYCTHCNRSGHETSACFKIVGYPDWWEDRSKNKTDPKGLCCGRGQVIQTQANTTQIVSNSAAVSSPIFNDADRQGLTGFSDDQWKTLQHLLGSSNSSSNSSNRLSGKNRDQLWILDTGATHHMTGHVDLFGELHSITPVSVRLPAGSNVLSTQQGTIKLSSRLCLHNVYLVPGFQANLISLGQLITDNYLIAQVTDMLLILQDRTTRMPFENLSELKVLCSGEDSFERMCNSAICTRCVDVYMEHENILNEETNNVEESMGNEEAIREDEAIDFVCEEEARVEAIVRECYDDEDENNTYRDTPPQSDCEEEELDTPYERWVRGSGELRIRQLFESVIEFKEAVFEYALKGGWNIQFSRWGKIKSEAVCGVQKGDKQCPWRIYCSYDEGTRHWMVKTFQEEHTCMKDGRCRILSDSHIAQLFLNDVRNDPL